MASAHVHCSPQYTQEEPFYNWNLPGFAEKTGHFTQLVWKETTQVGCGLTFCPPGAGSPFVINNAKGAWGKGGPARAPAGMQTSNRSLLLK